jgi:uncharacterized protein (TIGR03437 family)
LQAQAPSLLIDQTLMTFTAPQGGAAPGPQQRALFTSNTSPVNFNATATTVSGGQWLAVSPASGTTPATLNISVTPGALAPDTYQGTITVTSPGATNIVQIPVALVVGGGASTQVTPSSLTFNYSTGSSSPATQTLNINSTATPQSFTVTSGVPWMNAFPVQGTTSTTSSTPIIVLTNPTGQAEGTYTSNLIISVGGANVQIPVTMQISAAASIVVPMDPLRFNYQIGGTAAATQSQTLTVNSSGAALSYTVTPSGGAWLTATPGVGSTPGQVTVQVNATGLGAGEYRGNVTFTPTGGATTAAQSVPVVLTVSTLPLLNIAPAAVTFTHQFGGVPPAQQTVTPTSTGAALTYTASPITTKGGNWLTVNPMSNVSPGPFSIAVHPEGLTPDTYTGSIVITAAGAGNTPQTVPVTLKVTNEPQITLATNALAFNYQTGRTLPSPWIVTVGSTAAPLSFTAAATTSSGGNWLLVSPASGTTGTDLRIEVAPSVVSALAAGQYTGKVSVTSPGQTPQEIAVTLWVSSQALLNPSRAYLSFTAPAGGGIPNPETLTIASTGDPIDVNATVTVDTPQGSNWLVVGFTPGPSPRQLTVVGNPSGLPPGVYRGSINVTSPTAGVTNSGLVIPVTLTVTSGTLNVSPAALTFTQTSGGAAPASKNIDVTSTGSPLTWTATATTNIGGTWLSHGPGSGTTPGTISVGVSAGTLPAGTYTGQITVVSPGATGSPRIVPVTLTVTAAAAISLNKLALTYTAQQGGAAPAAQTFEVSSTVAGTAFTVAATATGGGTWLTATPASGVAPGVVTVNVNPQGLAAGTYSGAVTITAPGTSNTPQTVSVTLTVSGAPGPTRVALVNAASFLPGAVSPGEIVTITGTNLGPATGVTVQPVNNLLPTSSSGVEVTFDGIPAPLLYVSAGQINTIVPYEIAGRLTTRVQVRNQGAASEPLEQRVADTAPGVFTLNGSGSGPGAILNQNNSVNSSTAPAQKGSVVVIYATGEGQTFPRGVNGRITTDTLENLRMPLGGVSVTIGGQRAEIAYAGAAPSLVAGALQINARVPATAASGQQPVLITVGNGTSQQGVTVSIQ